MTASYDKNISQAQSNETQNLVDAFNALDTDAKLAWFYLVYKKMGDSVTPAAPAAAEPELSPILSEDYFKLSDEEQLAIMRDIVNRKDTEYSRAYGAIKENNQLLVWYAWAVAMGDKVVDLPSTYQPTKEINDLLSQIEKLEFEEQISVFRTISGELGYTDVKPIATQAETGKTSSL
ncbi:MULTISPECIES: orange carotenoid protein N-terminal domain-containing protein [unclassified Nostoc]|uniref:orange carotenoid protein N-terminal domain-containing protein n=1 Tax=unclassified Nostoc TaxID=2593658 RepID=UPI002AD5883D|nr:MULTISPECIES: orange carotenoid protein N-terminal domain-containing protein [unclassified Nostoc]MDZ8032180.1 orange carotenoid protein N-terminal domain-containing protein [Nostoc sp. DedSLP04]MDZ8096141.1 orange carotenoid protein N-terminal domain-containing protein [Nostoc sp. DedQUE05]MDZ8134897.1 orange carotenoid protein N-terminal domain-containing protein [Nostoc sp. DedQUE04]